MVFKPLPKGTVRKCLYFNECHKEEIHNGKRWKESWRKYNDRYKNGWICEKHYRKLIRNPRRTPEENKKYNDRKTKEQIKRNNDIRNAKQLCFGKEIKFYFKFLPKKTGYCEWCPNNIHDGSCKLTHRHHYFYLIIMPWACTVEICASCHGIETWRLRKLLWEVK